MTKFEIRRAILLAMATYPGPVTLLTLLGHPRIGASDEAVEEEWFALVRHGFLTQAPDRDDIAQLPQKEREVIAATGRTSPGAFLWGSPSIPESLPRRLDAISDEISRLPLSDQCNLMVELAGMISVQDGASVAVSIHFHPGVVHHTPREG